MLLSGRRLEVLRLLAAGFSTGAIAETLGITQNTTRTHIQGILAALRAHSRLEAIAIARTQGILADDMSPDSVVVAEIERLVDSDASHDEVLTGIRDALSRRRSMLPRAR